MRLLRSDTAAYHRRWYAANRKKRIAQITASNKRILARVKEAIINYLSTHPCVDCGEPDVVVLEFDHVRGKKVDHVSSMVRRRMSLASILKEIAKCDVRCANCHRRATAKRGSYYKVS